MNIEAKKKQIDKFKVWFKQGITDDGEKATLQITINRDLQQLLKSICIEEKIEEDFNFGLIKKMGDDSGLVKTIKKTTKIKRYKVKSVIYNQIFTDWKELLFICDMVDKGVFIFEAGGLDYIEKVRKRFKEGIYYLIKATLDVDLEQTISFKAT